MKRSVVVLFSLCLFATVLVLIKNPILVHTSSELRGTQTTAADKLRILASYGKLPLSFEANQGQTGPEVKFLSRGNGYTLFLTSNEAVLALKKSAAGPNPARDRSGAARRAAPNGVSRKGAATPAADAAGVRMKLVGANRQPQVAGLEQLLGKSNYFIGNDPAKWRTNVSTYAKVKYQNVYPGIDLVYYGNQRQLEYDFVIAPGADPGAIRIAMDDGNLRIDGDGDLVLETPGGEAEFRLHKPVIYQEIAGVRQSIEGNFLLHGAHQTGFEVARYDPSKPLIIDPVLVYSTYLGGNYNDYGQAIAVDSSGNAYVAGSTNSVTFPAVNAFQKTFGGGTCGTAPDTRPCSDVFVTKINAAGSALVYSTYLGGSGDDYGYGIAVNSSGNAYVTGSTASSDFPTANAFQAARGLGSCGTCSDVFVTEFNATGSALIYSTYLGGGNSDTGNAIALDSSGDAYVTGTTYSTNFPKANAFQGALVGVSDAFVTKFSPDGSTLVYSTYLGGINNSYGYGIAVDASGNVYVTGTTYSTNFPTSHPLQSALGGKADVFVTKLSPDGSALVDTTYLGGGDYDSGAGIAVDSAGNVYVTGTTASPKFPTANAFQATYGGGDHDAFVTKLSPDGSALVYSTFLGGYDDDYGNGIAVDSSGNAYVTGSTTSGTFPTLNAFQPTLAQECQILCPSDAFVTKLSGAGSTLVYSSYLGGTDTDIAYGIAVDSSGNAYLTGSTTSGNFPIVSPLQRSNLGVSDAFVTKISATQGATLTAISPASTVAGGPGFTLTVSGSDFFSTSVVQWNGGTRPTTFVSSSQLSAAIPASDIAAPGTAQVAVVNIAPGGGLSNALTFTINAPNPVPLLSSISPQTAAAAGAAFTLTVNGSNFISSSVVQWNGSSRTTTFVSATQLTAPISASDIASAGTAQVTVLNPAPGGGTSSALAFTITTPLPTINSGGVLSNASYSKPPVLAPGMLVEVFGTNLTDGSTAYTPTSTLPSRLAGARLLVNGFPAALSFASPIDIKGQLPVEIAGATSATIQVEVQTASGTLTGPSINLSVAPFAPGIFTWDFTGSGPGAILRNSDFSKICPAGRTDCPANAAARGDVVAIFMTGLGQVNGSWVTGQPNPQALPTTTTPLVTIGGIPAHVENSVLAVGYPGLYQVNVDVPLNAPTGDSVEVLVGIGGAVSNMVTMAIK